MTHQLILIYEYILKIMTNPHIGVQFYDSQIAFLVYEPLRHTIRHARLTGYEDSHK